MNLDLLPRFSHFLPQNRKILQGKQYLEQVLKKLLIKHWLALYAIGGGLFFSLAFAPKVIPGIEWIALIPIMSLFVLPLSTKKHFFAGWLAMTTALTVHLWWYFSILPLEWMALQTTPLLVFLIALTLLLTTGWLALSPALLLAFARHLGGQRLPQNLAVFCAGWPLFEFIRTYSHTLHPFLLGPGNIVGDHGSFMLLSYAGAEYAFVRGFASLLTEYGASLPLILSNAALLLVGVSLWHTKKTASGPHTQTSDIRPTTIAACVFSILCITCLTLGFIRHTKNTHKNSRSLHIAIVQTNISSAESRYLGEERKKRIGPRKTALREIVRGTMRNGAEVIVLPEGSPSVFDNDAPTLGEALKGKVAHPYPTNAEISAILGTESYRVLIDADVPALWSEQEHNTTSILDNRSGLIGTYEKRLLMPFGEYTPILIDRISGAFGFYWNNTRPSYIPGNSATVFQTEIGRIGLLTCSDLLSPKLSRASVRAGADILIFPSSTAILHGNLTLQAQTLAMAKIRAAATQKPIVYVANSGISFALDSTGKELWKSSGIGNDTAIIHIPVPLQ